MTTHNRRTFLKLSAVALACAAVSLVAAGNGPSCRGGRWASCRADEKGRYFLTAFDDGGKVLLDIPLPERGHGVTVHPNGRQCAVFARRPGTFMWVADLDSGEVVHRIESPPDRHFYGHGVFDPAGGFLYVTENDFETERGVIAVYDARGGYRRVGEFPSHGIGPHEVKLLGDGRTLVVANGGILTHPDLGRNKLNLGRMDPSLAYVDTADGRLLDAFRPPAKWHQLSIRHLDVTADDRVLVAMQFEGSADLRPPLVATHRGEEALRLLTAPPEVQDRMRNYCGSVCVDTGNAFFAVSSPRGNLVTLWSTEGGRYLDSIEMTDGCGVAAEKPAGRILVSSGKGSVRRFDLTGRGDASQDLPMELEARWDNHLTHWPSDVGNNG